MRSVSETRLAAMRYLSVTVPADLALAYLGHHVINLAGVDHCGVQFGVTTDTVVHNHLTTLFTGPRRLSFVARYPHGNVFHAVYALEGILACHILVRHMAVVASGIACMARVEPGGIVWRHDVTVDACPRVVAQIAVCSQDVQEEQSASHQTAQ